MEMRNASERPFFISLMKRLRWQIFVVVLTLAVVAVLLVTQQPVDNPIAPEPASGGIYTEALVGSFGRLNPLLDLNNPADRDIDRLIFCSLLKFSPEGIPIPDLAESWGVSADGTIYNLTIRPTAVWHDGDPVTSSDILFTINLLRNEFSAYPVDVRAMWDQVEITQLDDKNIKFKLPEPFVPFLDFLTFGILPEHILAGLPVEQLSSTDFNLSPIGCGPFRFEGFEVENGQASAIVLTASDTYFGGTPFIKQLVYRYYPTSDAAIEAYNAGEVLGLSTIPADKVATACANPLLACFSSRLPRLGMIIFNLGNNDTQFLQDKIIRRALFAGLNRQAMVDNILYGQAVVANSPLIPQTWAYYDGIDQIAFDPDEAIRSLKNAGFDLPSDSQVRVKEGTPLSFTLIFPDDAVHAELAKGIQQSWATIGVGIQLQAVPYDALFKDFLVPRNFQAALVDLDLSRSYDPDPYPFWHQAEITSGQNYSQWDNRTASEYLEQARVVADPNFRNRLYRNFQVVFAREMPALPLYYPIYTYAVDNRIQGVQAVPLFEPADRFNSITSWYLITRRSLEETQVPTGIP